ncbi:Flp pilus assembly protein CpaB [Candidatus Avelusimicrobium gallicola]|uniref:Flp pilus assembly protein CpaB n=1 Tax=Candidatus Avelusimicrobium gallicola TaxID=2562704 RepID=A0A1Y4DDF3_9BACT|nr:Flp pilus assembly protein CpaB [Elusimicrobium sp. An273]OUO57066.1 Flp pilus assembly protein CpaB [Elusimicrobium sp. An273]
MKKGIFLPLVVAILAAIVYAMIVSSAEKKLNASKNIKQVFVPVRDIKEREVIKRDFIKTVPVPAAYLQKDAFTYTTDADFKAIENTVARIQIPKGNQISKYAITSLSPEAGLSSKIPVQMRGFIINVPIATATMIKPDDNIDVLLTFEAVMKSGTRQKVTVTLLQNVKVLGVGSDLGQGLDAKAANAMKNKEEDAAAYSDSSALSLALSPRDAQYLALAQAEGDISVILRSHGDVTNYLMEIATFEKLFQ